MENKSVLCEGERKGERKKSEMGLIWHQISLYYNVAGMS